MTNQNNNPGPGGQPHNNPSSHNKDQKRNRPPESAHKGEDNASQDRKKASASATMPANNRSKSEKDQGGKGGQARSDKGGKGGSDKGGKGSSNR